MRFLLAFAQGGLLSPLLPLLRETFRVSPGELGLLTQNASIEINELSITEQKDFGVLSSAPTDMVGWVLTKLAIPGGPHGEHTLFV